MNPDKLETKGERVTAVWDFTRCEPEPEHWDYVRRRNEADQNRINQKQVNPPKE